MKKNEIITEIDIDIKDLTKRIINSFENTKRENPDWNW